MSNTSGKPLVILGFEGNHVDYGITSGTSHSGRAVVTGAGARTGTYAMECSSSEYFNVPLGQSVSNLGLSFAFYISAKGASDVATIFDIGLGFDRVRINASENLEIVGVDDNIKWTGTYTLSTATQYVMWIWYNEESTYYRDFQMRLYDNSLSLLEDSGLVGISTSPSGVGAFNSIFFGQTDDFGATTTIVFDDIYAVTGGPAPIGPKIVGVVPLADGTDDGFIGEDAGAVTWDNVDDIPPDDATSYATSSGGSSNVQTYTHALAPTDPGSSGNVLALQMRCRGSRDAGSGTGLATFRLRTSGGVYGSGTAINGTDATFRYLTSPAFPVSQANNGWTSGTGSETSIQDVEFGITRNAVFAHVRMTQIVMEVAWGANYTDDITRQTKGGHIL